MAKENPDTKPKEKADKSAFERFDRLAKKIIRVPKDQAQDPKNGTDGQASSA